MNLRRVTKQLKREAQANPGKATLLAVLAVVGFYFWAPLIAKWVSPEHGNEETESSVVAADGDSSSAHVPEPPATMQKAAEQRTWREWVAGAADHPRKGSARWRDERDPFSAAGKQRELMAQAQKLKDEQAAMRDKPQVAAGGITARNAKPKPISITPKSANLMLTSTVVGEERRLAMIKGNFVKRNTNFKQALVAEGDSLQIRTGSPSDATKAKDTKEAAKTATSKPAPKAGTKSSTKMENEAAAPAPAETEKKEENKEESGMMKVVRITPKSVWVEIAGKKHELRLATPKLVGNTTLRPVTEDR